jgi:ADP-ribosylglycohydrolase/protein-tyrosine phosphatase
MPMKDTGLDFGMLAAANGALALAPCPGMNGRTVDADLAALRDWGATRLISLTPSDESAELSISGLAAAATGSRLAFHALPVPDFGVPTGDTLTVWGRLSPLVHRALERGERVAIHCRAGLGRSGTLAALILTERGIAPDEAIAHVRAARPGAVETQAQEGFIRARGTYQNARERLIHASLIAGAIGDSLGAEIEFLSLAEIRRLYPDGIADLIPHQGLRGAITDDTQMTLFTAEGLLDAARSGGDAVLCVQDALVRWYGTQTGRHDGSGDGLVTDPRLFAVRAPGNTCLAALRPGATPRGGPAINDSKGCGTIMRVAPVAFLAARGAVRNLAMRTSALTHGHRTGQIAAAFWAELLADVAAGAPLEDAARTLVSVYAALPGTRETISAVEAALAAPRDGRAETVEQVGRGWIAEEALAVALYACLASRDLDEGLRIAVTHGGDSDSTGAIAGNMLGLLHREAVLAHRLASEVECADIIRALAREMASVDAVAA